MQFFRKPHQKYLLFTAFFGLLIIGWALSQFPHYNSKLNFSLLILLTIISQFAGTTASAAGTKSGITYSIDPAISIAAVPFFGPGSAALIQAITALIIWLLKPADQRTWKKSWPQLIFNASMHSISIFVAGWFFLWARDLLGENTILGFTLPWLIAAIINDQLNIWLLIIMLRLQFGAEVNPITEWRENIWAIPTGVLIMSVGGAILAFAIQQFDIIGILIFFLPILMSAFADRLYVQQMQAHMNNLEAIVEERTHALKELMVEKDAFLAVLTHDMKTPLTTISLYASLLQKKPSLIIEKPFLAETILRSQETLLNIVNNILDLEKLQVTGEMPLQKERFDIIPLAENALQSLKAQADQKEISLQSKFVTPSLIINADQNQIERVIVNLISNAIKYTPKTGSVDITIADDAPYAIVTIKDTGYGIPEDELPYVFDRFRRVAKHKDKAAGTGLGLAITKAIVEAHGGDISVQSIEGQGSCFMFRLPVS